MSCRSWQYINCLRISNKTCDEASFLVELTSNAFFTLYKDIKQKNTDSPLQLQPKQQKKRYRVRETFNCLIVANIMFLNCPSIRRAVTQIKIKI